MPLKVNQVSDAVAAMQPALAKVEALMGGTEAMRAAGETYMPKWPAEKTDAYTIRLKTSTLYNVFGRTIGNMAGKPFTEPVKWTDIDTTVEAWFDNIDLAGRNLHVFAKEVFTSGVKDGITHVLVDFPKTTGSDGKTILRTKAEEQAAGARPCAIHIKQSQILGWKSERVAGTEQLTQVRILESVTVPDGDFGSKTVAQVRLLEPGIWRLYRKNDKDEFVVYEEGTTTLKKIPLLTYYTKQTGFMTATPPLIDLADLNIKHWQSQSDQDSLLHIARVPLLVRIGIDNSEQEAPTNIGKSITDLPTGGDMKYVEHSGQAIGSGRDSLNDLEGQMESMGAELLKVRPGDRTATEASLDTAQAQCQLSAMANGLEDFLDQVVDEMAGWVGLPNQGDIDVFDDFASIAVDSTTLAPFVTGMSTLVAAALLSPESAFEECKRYGVINPDLTWEAEAEKIKAASMDLRGQSMQLNVKDTTIDETGA
ncbi:DUF4055 domain-containing protein [Undibacterium sp. TJN19]|uniref:DUF4055 domain-containing protein n=1 Tax=Undibacterium sp. TJN19 TaxID=3413055 RepID=UPI003BF3CE48